MRIVKLGEIATIKGGKRLPKGINLTAEPNQHPYIRVRDLNNRHTLELNNDFEYVDDKTQKTIARYVVDSGDIVLSIVGTIGLVSIIGESLQSANLTENCVKITELTGVDRDYLYYYLKSEFGQAEISKGTVGAVQAKLPIKNIQAIKIFLPELDVQEKIARILSSIDNKIETNEKINDNLFHLATALFNQTITENNDALSIKIISEIADVKGGKRLPKGINLQITPNDHPYIRVRDLNDASIVQLTPNFEYVDDETYKGISRYIVHTSDVIVSIVGTIGLTALIHESLDNANLTENCVKITNLKEVSPEYLLLFLRSTDGQNAICQGTVGAVQAKLPIKNIQSIPVPIIPEPQRNHLNDQLRAMFLSIAANLSENAYLIKIRDSLLPRLMSGEVNVSEIQI